MATKSRSNVLFVGGPFDGSEYFPAVGVSSFPHHLHVPHGNRLHLYRLMILPRKKGSKQIPVRYVHNGVVIADGAEIS